MGGIETVILILGERVGFTAPDGRPRVLAAAHPGRFIEQLNFMEKSTALLCRTLT